VVDFGSQDPHRGFDGARRLVDQVVEAIIKAAKTGKVGDGNIFITGVHALERVIRIPHGETEDAARRLRALPAREQRGAWGPVPTTGSGFKTHACGRSAFTRTAGT